MKKKGFVLIVVYLCAFLFRQPVTKNTFRQYRVLGKGGFGEVSRFLGKTNNMFYMFALHCI